jgi:hypothetical protein
VAGPQIDVKANVGAATQGIQQVDKAIDSAAKSAEKANKKPYRPLAPGSLQELREAVKLMERMSTLSRQMPATGGGNIGEGRGPAAPTSPPSSGPSPASSAGRGRGRWSNYGQVGDVGRFANAFTGGVGGATSTIANEAMAGARTPGGGFSPGGLLRGGLIGAGLFGAYKLGSAVSEGYDNAKSKAVDIDTLKRAMGDLGRSFSGLQIAADRSAVGLGINSNEAAKLALEYNRLSGGFRSESDVSSELRNSVGFGRSYGIDPGQSGQFFASMQFLGGAGKDEQSSRRLALLIGETISRTGMNARAAELISAIQSFASSTNRISLAAPNVEGYTGAFAGMMGIGIKGMNSDSAISILGAANQAMMGMGAAGEAGQNFTMAALNRSGGRLNPIQAAILSEGGMFGTRGAAFGKDSAYGKYMASEGVNISGMDLGSGNQTNFEAVRSHLDTLGGGADLKLDAAKRYFGLSSYNQAAALMSMKPQQMGRLEGLLGRNGVNVGDVNETGIATLGDIASAGGKDDLLRVFSSMKSRTGKGALTAGELGALDKASGGGTEEFRDALVKIAASKEQQETDGNKTRQSMKDIETATTQVGEKLLGPMNTMRDALLVAAGMGSGSLREKAAKLEKSDINDEIDRRLKASEQEYLVGKGANFGTAGSARSRRFLGAPGVDDAFVAEREAAEKKHLDEKRALEEERARRIKEVDGQLSAAKEAEAAVAEKRDVPSSGVQTTSTDRQSIINEIAKANGIDPRLLSAIPGLERSGANSTSPVGAKGEFQIMPGNVPSGMDPSNFKDGASMAATVLRDAQRRYPGNTAAQIAYYNGGWRAGDAVAAGRQAPSAETRDYLARAGKMGLIDDVPVPAGSAPAEKNSQQVVVVNGEFKLVDQSGRERAAQVAIQKKVGAPRSAGVDNGR